MDNQISQQCTPPSVTYYGFILVKKLNGTTICGRFPVIKKEVTIGRDNGCDIRILLDSVSDVHCTIYYINDTAYIRDKSILGTTKVNEKKIGKNNFLLQHSDEIEISGRKFVWEYANLYTGPNLSGRKSRLTNGSTTPRAVERRLSTQAKTPVQDSNNLLTPARSSIKTPSKTLISYNRTPIVVAASNMSQSTYNQITGHIKRQNSTTVSQSEPRPTKLCSTVPDSNVSLHDTKSTPRKSWTVTNNVSSNLTPNATSILDQLSSDRLKRDSTPEFNYSYRYEDDSVQFDSPEPPSVAFSDNQAGSILLDPDDQMYNDSLYTNNLPYSEPDLSASRRDTYSIDDGPIVIKPITTPAPGRSILKGSKTAKATRSSSRMVKFARLPNTDSKIKSSKSHFYSKPIFIPSGDDETNEADCSLDSKRSKQLDTEDLDDDLDGVQPLDSSVSSLINSPLVDNSSINKTSKRRSRGNKVMSLINSIEKRPTNESPKTSIRASDLLSVNRTKHENVSLNGSQDNESKLEGSVSSNRRINLENIFESEDSLKDSTCNLGNETMMTSKDCLAKSNGISSFNVDINDDVSGENNKDKTLEQEYNFASPLNLHCESNSSIAPHIDHSASTELKKVIDNPLKSETSTKKLNESARVTSANKRLRSSCIDNLLSLNVMNTSNHNNSYNIKKKSSTYLEKSTEKITTEDENQINKPTLVKKSAVKVKNSYTQKDSTKIIVNDFLDVPEFANKTNAISEVVDTTSYEESPSMIVQCMSEVFNSSDIMSTSTQPDNSLLDTYDVVDKDELSNSVEKGKLRNINKQGKINESLVNDKSVGSTNNSNRSMIADIIDSIKGQLDVIHSLDTSSYSNQETSVADTLSKTSNSSVLVLESVETNDSSLAVKVNETISKPNESTENIICSVSKKKPMCSNASINDSSSVKNCKESELPIKRTDTISVLNISSTKNLSSTPVVSSDLITIAEKENEVQDNSQDLILKKMSNLDNSKQVNKSAQSALQSSIIVANVVDNDMPNKLCSFKPTRKILKVIDISSNDGSDDNEVENLHIDQTGTNVENTLDTSIGKPQYESTPWTSSKSSKTRFNSTTHIQANNTSSSNRSYSPLPEPEIWYQMMKDFNESVKKASVSDNNAKNICTVNKNLFINEQSTCPPTIQVTAVKELIFNDANIDKSLLKNELKNNNIQCSLISSCVPNSGTKTRESLRLSRSSNNSSIGTAKRRKSPRLNELPTNTAKEIEVNTPKSKISDVLSVKNDIFDKNSNDETVKTVLSNTSSHFTKTTLTSSPQVEQSVPKVNSDCSTISNVLIKETNDSAHNTISDNRNDSSSSKSLITKVKRTRKMNSNPMASSKRKLRAKVNDSEQIKKKIGIKVVAEKTLTSSDTDESVSVLQTSGKMLRSKLNIEKKTPIEDTNKCTSSTISKKNIETATIKTKLTENTTNLAKTRRLTRSGTTLTEICLPKLTKNNKTLSPVKTKSAKVEKTKKTKSSKSNQKTQPKRILPSNPIKTNSCVSQYESEDSTSESLLVEVPSKTIKEDVNKGVEECPQLFNVPTTRNKDKNKKKDIDAKPQLIDPPKKNKEKVKKKDILNSSTPKISSPSRTRSSRKRPAGTPASQPNAKGPKCDASSKAASLATSLVISSPQGQLSSDKKSTSKLTVPQTSDNSLPETTIRNNKSLTRAKKREISSSSCDSAPSARKITRRQANVKETEAKKLPTTNHKTFSSESSCDSAQSARKMTRRKANVKDTETKKLTKTSRATSTSENSCDSAPSAGKTTRRQANVKETEIKKLATSTRLTSRAKDEPTNSTRVRFEPNVMEKLISPKQKKTRSTSTVAKEKNVTPRVLRTREKKK